MAKPKMKYRSGQVTLAVWENKREVNGQEQTYLTYQLDKNYMEGESWKTTNNYNKNNLLDVISVLNEALSELVKKESNE